MCGELENILTKYGSKSAVDSLKEYSLTEEISFIHPASEDLINSFEQSVSIFPPELKEIYSFTNGFFTPTLDLLPIFDKNNMKKTWDSINRANSEKTSFDFSSKWFDHLCIFARFSGAFALAFDKNDFSWWIEYPDGMHQKKSNLRDFLLAGLYAY
jgi:hypothetical protein